MCLKEDWELDNSKIVGWLTAGSWLFNVNIGGRGCKSGNQSLG